VKRVLVTGGAGFIGSIVVDKLREAGYEPRIMDVRHSPHHERGEVETVIGDIRRPHDVRRALEGCDLVVHMAAAADVGEVAKDPAGAEDLNSRGTLNVLEAAREAGVERVVYASTIWVYSDSNAERVDEDTPLSPPAHLYSATKLAGELYCRSYAELYDVEYTVLRFGIPYGPRARPAAVVPIFVRKALNGEPLTVAGGGKQSRQFVYVEDLADGVVKGLQPAAANRTYNLVGSEEVSVMEIASTVQSLIGDVEIEHVPARGADFKGAEVDGGRAERELGWRPETPFREGVRRYIAWHKEQEAVAQQRQPRIAVARAWATSAARMIAAVALAACVGIAALGLANVNTRDDPTDRAAFVALLVLLMLPLGVVADIDWERSRRRALGTVLTLAGVAAAAVLIIPTPTYLAGVVHDHQIMTALLALAVGGVVFLARRLGRPSESASDSAA
jgi:UDP-glucose 4-epimerase